MKLLLENWREFLKENLSDKPIVFTASGKGVFLPSDHPKHEEGKIAKGIIKIPNEEEKAKILPILKNHGFWYEGTGEGGGGGTVESNWIKDTLGFKSPKSHGSFDDEVGEYEGMEWGIVVTSQPQKLIALESDTKTSSYDIFYRAMVKGIVGNPMSESEAKEFIELLKSDGLDLENMTNIKEAIEKFDKLAFGGNTTADGINKDTNLGKFIQDIQKKRRAKIYSLADEKGGVFFLGSDHLAAMKKEMGGQ